LNTRRQRSDRNRFVDAPWAGPSQDAGDDELVPPPELWEAGICDARYSILGREINELIESHVMRVEPLPDACLFVCECENGDCEDRIQTTLQRHRLIREDGSFMVVAGHESRDHLVVDREASWLSVRKAGNPDGSAKSGVGLGFPVLHTSLGPKPTQLGRLASCVSRSNATRTTTHHVLPTPRLSTAASHLSRMVSPALEIPPGAMGTVGRFLAALVISASVVAGSGGPDAVATPAETPRTEQTNWLEEPSPPGPAARPEAEPLSTEAPPPTQPASEGASAGHFVAQAQAPAEPDLEAPFSEPATPGPETSVPEPPETVGDSTETGGAPPGEAPLEVPTSAPSEVATPAQEVATGTDSPMTAPAEDAIPASGGQDPTGVAQESDVPSTEVEKPDPGPAPAPSVSAPEAAATNLVEGITPAPSVAASPNEILPPVNDAGALVKTSTAEPAPAQILASLLQTIENTTPAAETNSAGSSLLPDKPLQNALPGSGWEKPIRTALANAIPPAEGEKPNLGPALAPSIQAPLPEATNLVEGITPAPAGAASPKEILPQVSDAGALAPTSTAEPAPAEILPSPLQPIQNDVPPEKIKPAESSVLPVEPLGTLQSQPLPTYPIPSAPTALEASPAAVPLPPTGANEIERVPVPATSPLPSLQPGL
jgi:hypothetical protein